VLLPGSQLGRAFFNKIKRGRRVATRYDKLAASYLAFVQLASILLWLAVNESTAYGSGVMSASPFACIVTLR
jgi:hypothetical protein